MFCQNSLCWLLVPFIAVYVILMPACDGDSQDWSKKDADFLIEKLESESWQDRAKAARTLEEYGKHFFLVKA